MGVWVNPEPAAQPQNGTSTCETYIYQLMQSTCFPSDGGPFNVAAVNVKLLPIGNSTGEQVDSGYPSYVILPETYDDTSADASASDAGSEQAPANGGWQLPSGGEESVPDPSDPGDPEGGEEAVPDPGEQGDPEGGEEETT